MSEFFKDKFRRTELFLSEVVRNGSKGMYRLHGDNVPVLFRATVVAVDVFGGRLENPSGTGTVKHVIDGKTLEVSANVGPENPRNSIKARIITDGLDQFIDDSRLRVFWPFFPEHFSVPIKPGEHVYVMFEDSDFQHGLWITKVAGQENTNFFKGEDSFKKDSSLSSKFGDAPPDQSLNTDQAASESKPVSNLLSLFGDS